MLVLLTALLAAAVQHRCSGALLLPGPAAAFYATYPTQYDQHQYHSQDSLGQYAYGYSGALSSKAETKTLDGVTRGSYSYIDANNQLQTVAYTADALNGFRATATNLPKAPSALPLDAGLARLAPLPVLETAEVAAARAEHMAAYEAVLARDEQQRQRQQQQQQQETKPADEANDDDNGADNEQPPEFKPRIVTPPQEGFLVPTPTAPAAGSFSYAYNMPGFYYRAYPAAFYTPALRPASLQYAFSAAAAAALPHPPAPTFAFQKFQAPTAPAPAVEQPQKAAAAESKPQFFRGAVEQHPAIVVTDTVAVRAERFSAAQHKAARAAFDAHKAQVDAAIAAGEQAAEKQ